MTSELNKEIVPTSIGEAPTAQMADADMLEKARAAVANVLQPKPPAQGNQPTQFMQLVQSMRLPLAAMFNGTGTLFPGVDKPVVLAAMAATWAELLSQATFNPQNVVEMTQMRSDVLKVFTAALRSAK